MPSRGFDNPFDMFCSRWSFESAPFPSNSKYWIGSEVRVKLHSGSTMHILIKRYVSGDFVSKRNEKISSFLSSTNPAKKSIKTAGTLPWRIVVNRLVDRVYSTVAIAQPNLHQCPLRLISRVILHALISAHRLIALACRLVMVLDRYHWCQRENAADRLLFEGLHQPVELHQQLEVLNIKLC